MCEKILHMLKARRYAYLENINCIGPNCFGPVSAGYRRLMEVKIAELTDIIEEIEREQKQKQNDIIIA